MFTFCSSQYAGMPHNYVDISLPTAQYVHLPSSTCSTCSAQLIDFELKVQGKVYKC